MTKDQRAEECVKNILLHGLIDWNSPWDIEGAVVHGLGKTDVPEAALDLIRNLLESGLVTVGDVRNGVFEPWGLSHAQSLARLRETYRELWDRPGDLYGAYWLLNTDAGDRLAREAQRERGLT